MKSIKLSGQIPSEFQPVDLTATATDFLGWPGRMLHGMKSAPPEERVVWNGNVLVGNQKVWYGDISLRDSAKALQLLANAAQQKVYVLRERDARFGSENNPDLTRAVEVFEPQV